MSACRMFNIRSQHSIRADPFIRNSVKAPHNEAVGKVPSSEPNPHVMETQQSPHK